MAWNIMINSIMWRGLMANNFMRYGIELFPEHRIELSLEHRIELSLEHRIELFSKHRIEPLLNSYVGHLFLHKSYTGH